MFWHISLIFIFFNLCVVACLNNGVARTPPMGWLAWERFKCNIDCDNDPSNCISEKLFIEMADRLVDEGYKDAGYEYINIDDCWMAEKRDVNGNIVADYLRFPRGIRFLVDYVHSKGLKLGIYHDFGLRSCMGYPGIIGHMKQDIKKFVEWDIDMLKLDGCHSENYNLDTGYITVGKLLKKFKKPVLYSCSWPYYQLFGGVQPKYEQISVHCNTWRNYHDIQDSWYLILEVIDFFGDNQEVIAPHVGPGKWSDPDMLMIGNHHLTVGQSRAQMAVWAMIPGPLLMSNDLRDIKPEVKEILLNKKVIAVNQDSLGIPGKRIYKELEVEVWKRPVSSIVDNHTSDDTLDYVLLFLNRHNTKKATIIFTLDEFEIPEEDTYRVKNLFTGEEESYTIYESIKITVLPQDVIMLRCEMLHAVYFPSDILDDL